MVPTAPWGVVGALLFDLVHALRRPGEERVHVQARNGGGQQPDRREHREPTAHVFGYGQRY